MSAPTKDECLRGHPFSDRNTAYRGKLRQKVCRKCEKLRRDRAARQRAYAAWEEQS